MRRATSDGFGQWSIVFSRVFVFVKGSFLLGQAFFFSLECALFLKTICFWFVLFLSL